MQACDELRNLEVGAGVGVAAAWVQRLHMRLANAFVAQPPRQHVLFMRRMGNALRARSGRTS